MSIASRGGIATKMACRQSWQRWRTYSRRRRGSHAGWIGRMRDAIVRFRWEYKPSA